MNLHELPMILFTVIAQMSVGTFVALGVMELVIGRRADQHTVRRLYEPVLYAIGPALVLGLAVSMLHMNDVTNVLNVVRNWESSWLSREILFGMGFAALGFAFALTQWFQWSTQRVRGILGVATAIVGLGLVWSMAQIYSSLEAVPAWDTPFVAVHFFGTTVILGALAVGCALMFTALVRRRNEAAVTAPRPEPDPATGSGRGGVALATKPTTGLPSVRARVAEINAPTTNAEWELTTRVLQWIAVVTAVAGLAVLISYPLYISALASSNEAGQAAAGVFSGGFFTVRLVLLGLAAVVLALFWYRSAGTAVRENPKPLALLITAAFVLALVAEFMGRSLHYDALFRIGM